MERREQIARIVDGEAFRPGVPAEIRSGMAGSIVADIERRDRALAKADQIMGLEGEELSALRKLFDALIDRFWIEQWMEIDGGDFQDIAEWAGLIRPEPYDPEKHAYSDDASPGDPWFVRVFLKAPTDDQ